jgi:uncharacterized repeat protein (TIGR01451 family)
MAIPYLWSGWRTRRLVVLLLGLAILLGFLYFPPLTRVAAQTPVSDLTINTYLASGAVSPGYELTYDLTFANGGPDPADDVIITATLPLSTTYLTYSGAYSPTISGQQLIWSIGALPANSSYNLNYTVHLAEAAPVDSILTHTVQIATTTTDPDLTNNSATLTNTVTSSTPDLSLSTNWTGALARDSEVTYYLYYQNNFSFR